MAAQYIDSQYVYERFSESLTLALTRSGIVLESVIESATAAVQVLVERLGFTAPNTTSDLTTSQLLKGATFAALWQMLAEMPKASLKLPDGWASNPFKLMLDSIEDGTASKRLAADGLTLDTATAIGGSLWSDRSTTADDPRRTTNDELGSY